MATWQKLMRIRLDTALNHLLIRQQLFYVLARQRMGVAGSRRVCACGCGGVYRRGYAAVHVPHSHSDRDQQLSSHACMYV